MDMLQPTVFTEITPLSMCLPYTVLRTDMATNQDTIRVPQAWDSMSHRSGAQQCYGVEGWS